MAEEINVSFKSRSDSLFSCLDSLEKKHEEKLQEYNSSCLDNRQTNCKNRDLNIQKERNDAKPYRSSKYDSPRNSNKGHHRKKLPDHISNPEKWTKYSLKHDGSTKISRGLSDDQLNTKIAHDFLKDLKERKSLHNNSSNKTLREESDKVVFKKPSTFNDHKDNIKRIEMSRGTSASRSFVMKTYEFGNKNKKRLTETKTISSIDEANTEVSIHFNEEDDTKYQDDDDKDYNEDDDDHVTNDAESSKPGETTCTFNIRKKNNRKNVRKKALDD